MQSNIYGNVQIENRNQYPAKKTTVGRNAAFLYEALTISAAKFTRIPIPFNAVVSVRYSRLYNNRNFTNAVYRQRLASLPQSHHTTSGYACSDMTAEWKS